MDAISITILSFLVVNIAGIAFSYGSLTQKVKDTNRRLDNDIMHRLDQIDKRLDGIEKRLIEKDS